MHPEFAGIIDDTLAVRDALCPLAKVAVLSNSTMLHKEEVMNALLKIDECIMKLDSVNDERMRQIDDPDRHDFTCEKLVRQLCRFDGRLVIQTMFLRGHRDGVVIDNTSDEEVINNLPCERVIFFSSGLYSLNSSFSIRLRCAFFVFS